MQFKLSKRLESIVSLIDMADLIIDVGTDHGLIPISLIKENKSKKIIASDLRKAPLKSAEKNILNENLEEKIDLVLSDGLKNIFEIYDILKYNKIIIIISGMGAETIIKILDDEKLKIDDRFSFVLQPQNNFHLLREYLYKNSFSILEEKIVFDVKFYNIMKVKKQNFKVEIKDELKEYYIGNHILDAEYFDYVNYELNKLQKTIESIKKSNDDLNDKIEKLEKLKDLYKKEIK